MTSIQISSDASQLEVYIEAFVVAEVTQVENNHHRKLFRIVQVQMIDAIEIDFVRMNRNRVANVPLGTLIPGL